MKTKVEETKQRRSWVTLGLAAVRRVTCLAGPYGLLTKVRVGVVVRIRVRVTIVTQRKT
jgi:hypothetical protein